MTFPLPRQDRRWYSLPDLAATDVGGPIAVPVTRWEASFDQLLTWHPAQPHPQLPSVPSWLLAGPDFPGPGDPSTHEPTEIVIFHSVAPRVRLVDSPESVSQTSDTVSLA